METDKITNVVEAPESGVLLKILVAKGQTAAVKSVIAVIGEPGENVDAWTAQSQPAAEGAPKAAAPKGAPAGKASASDVRAMPAARRAAKELGIDLAQVAGTGKDGAVTEKDVLAYKAALDSAPVAPAEEAGAAEPCDDEIVPMEGMRRIIADNMQASLQNAAQLTVSVDCDVTEAEELRQKAIAPTLISPSARKEWVWIIGMAPAHTPRMANSRRSRSRAATASSHSAGMSAIQPVSSVRWGIIMSQITFTQRRFRSGWFVGVR